MTMHQILDSDIQARDKLRTVWSMAPTTSPDLSCIKYTMGWFVRDQMLRLKLIQFDQYEELMSAMSIMADENEYQFE